jgi:hypothetical protein
MLATQLGTCNTLLFNSTVAGARGNPSLYSLGLVVNSIRIILLVSKNVTKYDHEHPERRGGEEFTALEGTGTTPGWQTPHKGEIRPGATVKIGPYGILLITLHPAP